MTTYEQLLRAAETCQRDALFVLADCAEESGEAELAAGYRWMAEKSRWPKWDEDEKVWKLYAHQGWDEGRTPYDPEDLPLAALSSTGSVKWFDYDSCGEALHAGATAVGKWLARKEKP